MSLALSWHQFDIVSTCIFGASRQIGAQPSRGTQPPFLLVLQLLTHCVCIPVSICLRPLCVRLLLTHCVCRERLQFI